MAKRGPQSTLNHLNWNESEEPEEMGEFAKASDDVIKQRVIKKARRRVADDADSTAAAAPSSVFGGFKGFASTPLAKADAGGPKTFSFLSTLGAPATTKTNGNGTATVSSSGTGIGASNTAAPMFSLGSNATTAATAPSDAAKKAFPTFGSAASLKADSTDGAKSAPTSSGFGISSTKEGGTDSSKNLFSLATSSAQPTSTDAGAKPFSFGSLAPKTTDSTPPGKTFTFGSPMGKDASITSITPKATFSFGTFAAQADTGEAEKKSPTFTSPVAAGKDSSGSAAAKTGMFSFGSNATKTDTSDTEKKSSTLVGFSFGSNAAKSDASGETPEQKPLPSFTFGSSPAAAPKNPSPKTTFMFGSNAAPKSDASEPVEKKSFTFGSSAANKDKDGAAATATPITDAASPSKPTSTFSFGSNAAKSDTSGVDKKATFTFGTGAAKTGFGSLASSSTTAAGSFATVAPTTAKASSGEKKSPEPGTFAKSMESSDSVVKKMFNFAEAGTKSGAATPPKPQPAAAADAVDKGLTFGEKVVSLNFAFLAWINQKVPENPCCKLHVVFRDYERHFARIESEMTPEEIAATIMNDPMVPNGKHTEPNEKPTGQAKEKQKEEKKEKEKEKEPAKSGFFFGTMAKEATKPAAPAPSSTPAPAPSSGGFASGATKPFSFGAASSSTVSTSSPSFFAGASTFGTGKPAAGGFTFGNVAKPTATPDSSAAGAADKGATEAEADEDEPPKVEFTPVEEKDSLFSKRCKLFVKAAGSYSDRGVGTLHIKKVDGKVQLLVRADTSLGNILLNIILNESVPLQRMGKNNVMMICLPTPDSKPPPTSVLLRVKTTEEADELHETLLKYKPQ
uniref:RanBD1 domain-containing protein n=1 Tax=Anopheles dirus TaxID=7168 RepID=A0A182NB96_9DIPT